jgi:hypothetical protein
VAHSSLPFFTIYTEDAPSFAAFSRRVGAGLMAPIRHNEDVASDRVATYPFDSAQSGLLQKAAGMGHAQLFLGE